jgi:type IV secretion system protein VirB3
MSAVDTGLIDDPLFVGVTRPAMRWGVTYTAIIFNVIFVMELFLVSKKLLVVLIAIPIHGMCMLLCARDARFFDLAVLWAQTRLPGLLRTLRFWKASTYSPLLLDLPGRGDRRRAVRVVV